MVQYVVHLESKHRLGVKSV